MAHTLELRDGILRVRITGVLDGLALAELWSAIAAFEVQTTGPLPSRVVDLSGVTSIEFQFAAMNRVIDPRRTQELRNSIRTAIVAPTPAHIGTARMFKLLMTNPQIEIEVVTTEAEALAWIRSGSTPAPRQA